MVKEARENGFTMKEITADKAYSSRDNTDLAFEMGATPYIPYKSNATGKSRGSLMWSKMYHYFMLNREEFLEHYHKRSNVETAIGMVKAKFGDKLKTKKYESQVNEVYCRLIAHNLCVLTQEMHELGIDPKFTF